MFAWLLLLPPPPRLLLLMLQLAEEMPMQRLEIRRGHRACPAGRLQRAIRLFAGKAAPNYWPTGGPCASAAGWGGENRSRNTLATAMQWLDENATRIYWVGQFVVV